MPRARTRGRGSPAAVAGAALLALVAGVACAPKQRIPLAAEPAPVAVYVDGQLQVGAPAEVELRADRDHTLYFKKEGYTSKLVVLETKSDDDGKRLQPDQVRVTLEPRGGTGREVEIERDVPAGGRGESDGER
jgi:hypothetical protein